MTRAMLAKMPRKIGGGGCAGVKEEKLKKAELLDRKPKIGERMGVEFMGALKTQQDREAGMALTLHSDDESGVSEDAEESRKKS
jgi:hypothetical protein